MGSKRLLLLGGGGHCKAIIDSLITTDAYAQIGLVCAEGNGASLRGIQQVGTDAQLSALFSEGWTDAFVAVGSVGSTVIRRKLYCMVKEIGFSVPHVIDRSATVAGDSDVGEGVYIGKHAVVNAGATLDACAIVNTGAIVEHDCSIGSFAHISSGAVLCGQVTVGSDTHIGANSTIRQQLVIGHGSIIGISSVVTKNIPDYAEAYGNPCRVVRMI
ncbi:MAG: acetyltransferase [Clostridia bacterium]